MLSELRLKLYLVLVAVASLIVSAHGVGVAEACHHAPRRVAEIHLAAYVCREDAALPYPAVDVKAYARGAEGVVVAEEARAEELRNVEIHAALGIGEHVARVVDEGQSCAEIPCAAVHALEEFRAFDVLSPDIVEGDGGAYVCVAGDAYHEARLHLRLPPLHLALVEVVVAHVVAHAPEVCGEGEEVCGIVEAVPVFREDMCAAHAEHVEAHGGDIAEEADIGGREDGVAALGAVESCRHESYAELRVGAVVRSADDAEVEAFVFLRLVGVVEVVEQALYHSAFLRHGVAVHGVCRGRHHVCTGRQAAIVSCHGGYGQEKEEKEW